MSFDKLNIVDKKTHKESYFGEVQTDFNMSLTCDGTKESCKVEIFNNVRKPLEPFTIVQMEDTTTWWVVQKDKVQKYTNEIGGYYKHSISLLGAFELLNVRELTNCGFNANKYTIRQFLTRLFSLSSFEFNVDFDDLEEYMSLDTPITYLKTFQNYTLASAIKELFAGMNLTPKLRFMVNPATHRITSAVLGCYSRSGNNQNTIDIESFDNAEEQSSFDGENFGTRVLSNVENCVSANVVRYPAYGGARLTSSEEIVNEKNAILRLPSNVYEVKNITIYQPVNLFIYDIHGEQVVISLDRAYSTDNLIKRVNNIFAQYGINELSEEEKEIVIEFFNTKILKKLENGGIYNQLDNTLTGNWYYGLSSHGYQTWWALNIKQYADVSYGFSPTSDTWKNIVSWEQGRDYLENFDICNNNAFTGSAIIRELQDGTGRNLTISIDYMTPYKVGIAVEYVPMSDLVVKTDNDKDSNDTQLYNQNGKLVDSKAVSKLINSHTQEISSEEIVRYGTYYDFNDIPKPSTKVSFDNKTYIINNVSIDMHENDDDGYYMECMFTMTENVACKSTMVSANTNIRDYECPQQNNVKRIQTYRDYVELSYDIENIHQEESYLPYIQATLFELGSEKLGFGQNFTLMFSSKISNNRTYYYQIGTTMYELNRQTIIVADFKDNNIIGYEAGKVYSTFSVNEIKDIYNGTHKNINTPISYVENDGTTKDLDLYFLTEEHINDVYENYNAGNLANFFVSIPYEMFYYMVSNDDFLININEEDYNKDGLEAPVFEYCCEVGNTEGIIFGDDFLKYYKSSLGIRYIAIIVDGNITVNDENCSNYLTNYETFKEVNIDIVKKEPSDRYATILRIDFDNLSSNIKGKTIILFAWENNTIVPFRFMFSINNCKKELESGKLLLGINNYRLR